AAARRDHRAAVDKRRRVGRMDQPAPGSLAHEWSKLAALEHVRHQIAARAGHLVNDHYLWTPDTRRRTGERITIAGDVIKVTVKVATQNIDDVIRRRAAAVVTLVNHHAFLVLLRKVVAIETRVARLSGVVKINVGKLTVRKFLNQPPV